MLFKLNTTVDNVHVLVFHNLNEYKRRMNECMTKWAMSTSGILLTNYVFIFDF